jgi:hypothetical protein
MSRCTHSGIGSYECFSSLLETVGDNRLFRAAILIYSAFTCGMNYSDQSAQDCQIMVSTHDLASQVPAIHMSCPGIL